MAFEMYIGVKKLIYFFSLISIQQTTSNNIKHEHSGQI